MSEVLRIKNFFKEQFIAVPSEWVQACISFVKAENGQNLSIQQLKNLVYQQWLNADLEEIGVCAFGPICKNLLSTQKTILSGNFALQVDGIRDVSRPAYSQLKELEQDINSNAEFSAAPPNTQPSWEAKPTRMLMLNLTDGCSHIQGMEYRPISILSPNFPPGIKVVIQGPIDCRFGVLLLTPEKIKVLGGEVEEKLTRFSRKAILREILQIPDEDVNGISEAVNSRDSMQMPNENQPPEDSFADETPRSQHQNQAHSSSSRLQNTSNGQSRQGSQIQSTSKRDASENSHLGFQQNSGHSLGSRLSWQQNSASATQRNTLSRNQGQNQNMFNSIDDFEIEDDDFDLNVDPDMLDELERSFNKSKSFETPEEDNDIWEEDEDVVRDMMAFQDDNAGFEIPTMDYDESPCTSSQSVPSDKPFTYLVSAIKESSANYIISIKGFIITVLSKLACTNDKGWSLMVKINDGTATLDVNIHDKVLEGIIGVSSEIMLKMQVQAAKDPEKRSEIMKAVSKCKPALQEINCLMDIEFSPGSTPCLIKYYPVSHLNAQQLLERVRSRS